MDNPEGLVKICDSMARLSDETMAQCVPSFLVSDLEEAQQFQQNSPHDMWIFKAAKSIHILNSFNDLQENRLQGLRFSLFMIAIVLISNSRGITTSKEINAS